MQRDHCIIDYPETHQVAEITQGSHKFHDAGGAEYNHDQRANKESNMGGLEFRMQPGEKVGKMSIAPQCIQNAGKTVQ